MSVEYDGKRRPYGSGVWKPSGWDPRIEYNRRLKRFEEQKRVDLPKLRKKLTLLNMVLEDKAIMQKNVVNAVWKNRELLHNYRDAVDKNKIGEQYEQLEKSATEHKKWLKSMVHKKGSQLPEKLIKDIREWIAKNEQVAQRMENDADQIEFIMKVHPIVMEYSEEYNRVERLKRAAEESAETAQAVRKKKQKITPTGTSLTLAPNIIEDSEYSVAGGKRGASTTLEAYIKRLEVDNNLKEIANRYMIAAGKSHAIKMNRESIHNNWICKQPGCQGKLDYDARECVMSCIECGICESNVQLWDGQRPYGQQIIIDRYFNNNPHSSLTIRGDGVDAAMYANNSSNRERMAHYKQKFAAATAQLSKKLDPKLLELFWAEAHRRRHAYMNRDRARLILRELELQQHYNADATLAKLFSEKPVPIFTDERRKVLDEMFQDALVLFDRCPSDIKKRTNFLPYNYFFYQACFMNGWDEYLSMFPLPDGNDVKADCDLTWRWMCENKSWGTGWSFYPTF